MAIWTIPNIISFARLLGVPVLIYFGLFSVNDLACFLLFVYSGVSDWLDGYLARKLHQQSEFGAQLDPIADRFYIIASLVVLLMRDLMPLVIFIAIALREVFMGAVLAYLNRKGFGRPEVHYIGKAGTTMLLYSVPLIFLGNINGFDLARWCGIAFLMWGVVTYWVAGLLYALQAARTTRLSI